MSDRINLHIRTDRLAVPTDLLVALGKAMDNMCPGATLSACDCCDFRITGERR